MMKIITFTSDFGNKDWFVAAVKGEILKVNKDVLIVDVTHRLTPQDIKSTAFLLKSVYKNFPQGTTHLVVVDPGVGSKRKPIIVESDKHYFVGPDNGIFSYIYNKDSKVYEIKVRRKLSTTFHARDIFGPVAARLSKGSSPKKLGSRIKKYFKFEFPKLRKKGDKIYGEVLYIDHFGNLITNIENNLDVGQFYISKKKILVKKYYGEGEPNEIISVKGSSGYFEIACNKGNAQDVLRAYPSLKISGKISIT